MSRSVVLISGSHLGAGDDELGAALMLAAVKNLGGLDEAPSHLLFMNSGINLCCEGSKALTDLRALVDQGAELLVCGTCLDWFEKDEQLAVGRRSNMGEILGAMNTAPRVIKL